MGEGDVWSALPAIFGPYAPIVGAVILVWALFTRSNKGGEGVSVSRSDHEKLESRVHDLEAKVNQIIGAQGAK